MRSYEKYVAGNSDYYIYTPSATAEKLYFYPLYSGYFYYEPGYHLKRSRYDSFLIMLITEGSCTVHLKDTTYTASKGQVVLIDCYALHEYGSDTKWQSSWLHFDGLLARNYYEHISNIYGNIILPRDSKTVERMLSRICDTFRKRAPIREALLSHDITLILTELLLSGNERGTDTAVSSALEDTIAYMNEHFSADLSLKDLAKKASLSPFYFTRVFTKETGMTPHRYLIATRLNATKYLLTTTDKTIKEIAFNSGFKSESSFCYTFKKWEGVTPSEYRSLK